MAAGEGLHERRRVGAIAQRQPSQLEAGRPALGAFDQRRHLLLCQAQPHASAQKAAASSTLKLRSAARTSII